MRRIAVVVAGLIIAASAGAGIRTVANATIIDFTAPSQGNTAACGLPLQSQPFAPGTMLVAFAQLESGGGVVVWRDSTVVAPGVRVSFSHPTPAPGTYTVRAWSKAGGLPSCDTTAMYVVAPCAPAVGILQVR